MQRSLPSPVPRSRAAWLPTLAVARRARSGRRRRGFTLLELMVVVIIVGLLAVMAIPSMNDAALDRHVYEDAANIQDMIREARARAIGRGGAVMVALSTSSGAGTFRSYEIRSDVDGGQNLPLTSCKAPTDWTVASSLNVVDVADTANTYESRANIRATIYDATGTAVAAAYLCFTPAGRTFYSTSAVFDGQTAMTSAISVKVGRYKSDNSTPYGIVRTVAIPPTGAARIISGGS